jgi:hypothetical protein
MSATNQGLKVVFGVAMSLAINAMIVYGCLVTVLLH